MRPSRGQETLWVQAAGVGLAVAPDPAGAALPEVLHWGASLPDPEDAYPALLHATAPGVPGSAPDAPWPFTVLPGQADGWSGTPGFAGHRSGGATAPRWQSVTCSADAESLT